MKGCNFFGKKLANICSFVGGRISVQQEKVWKAETLFRIRRPTVQGMFKQLATILDVVRRSFVTKSAGIAAMVSSVRVDFGRPSLSSFSTSSLLSQNREYRLKTFDPHKFSFP
jgi:hypothetical protein